MRRLLAATTSLLLLAGAAHAEKYVMITHTQGTDPFWPVVEKGGRDAAQAVGAEFEYNFAASGDMADMARLIETAAATQPDGIIVSLPDAAALGGAIRAASESGIPVITINSGAEHSKEVGALMHVGQPERLAGRAAGERAKAEGATKSLCLNQEAYNTALVERCEGYFEALGQQLSTPEENPATCRRKSLPPEEFWGWGLERAPRPGSSALQIAGGCRGALAREGQSVVGIS